VTDWLGRPAMRTWEGFRIGSGPAAHYSTSNNTQPLDVDKPMFSLFGQEYATDDSSMQCVVCDKLVGYDSFTFYNKQFYHVQCFHLQFYHGNDR
jgi:hypothetical protein